MKPTILTCAVTGTFPTREHNPALPVTPAEIAEACIGAAKAGAAICHIHVREPDSGRASMKIEYYREVVQRIRGSGTDLIINLTTGPGGRFIPSDDDPTKPAPGTLFKAPEIRTEHIVELKPEICTLDLNTMWFGGGAVINTPRNLRIMAERIYAAGVKPELEVFDSGHIALSLDMIKRGLLEAQPLFQVVMGVPWGAPATTEILAAMKSLLPVGAPWAAFGVGRSQFPMVAQALLLGGHIRVGLEDNLYLSKGELAPDNASLVLKAATIVDALGSRLATPDEARTALGIARR